MASNYFFKPIFYCHEDQTILFKFDDDLELIRFPQFTIKRPIKTEKDLGREMKKLDSFMIKLGIAYLPTPFRKSKIEIAEGQEQSFFFHVKQVSKMPVSDKYIWVKTTEAIENDDDIAWWDQMAVIAYFSDLEKN